MTSATPPYVPPAILTTPLSLHQTLIDFLIVSIHQLLYTRRLYPLSSFISCRRYNTPIRQSRHPSVCQWITSSLSHISTLLNQGSVRAIVFIVFDDRNEVLERVIFDVGRFPVIKAKGDTYVKFEGRMDKEGREGKVGVSRVDVEEELRATVKKLIGASESLRPLERPEECTWSLAVELRDEAAAPIGHPQPWIPSEASLQTGEKRSESIGRDLGGAKSHPVRLVEAGEFILETWIEEGSAKVGFDDDDGDPP